MLIYFKYLQLQIGRLEGGE